MKIAILILTSLFLFACASKVETEAFNPNHKLANKKTVNIPPVDPNDNIGTDPDSPWTPSPDGLNYKVKRLDGTDVTFEDIARGNQSKAFLLNFFQPQCMSCTMEAKEISDHYDESFRNNDFHIISIGTYSDISDIIEWKAENNINYTVYFDEYGVFDELTPEVMFPLNIFLTSKLVPTGLSNAALTLDEIIKNLTSASKGE